MACCVSVASLARPRPFLSVVADIRKKKKRKRERERERERGKKIRGHFKRRPRLDTKGRLSRSPIIGRWLEREREREKEEIKIVETTGSAGVDDTPFPRLHARP